MMPEIHIGDFVFLKGDNIPWNMGIVTDTINGYIFLNYGRMGKVSISGLRIPEKIEDVLEIWRQDFRKMKRHIWKKENNWIKRTRVMEWRLF